MNRASHAAPVWPRRALLFLGCLALVGCDDAASTDDVPDQVPQDAPEVPCEALFGQPTESTGLAPAACGPSCECGAAPWTPPVYEQAWIDGRPVDLSSRHTQLRDKYRQKYADG